MSMISAGGRHLRGAASRCVIAAAVSGAAWLAASSGSWAADVTFERLLHPEPQNWLMNHHDFSSQRFSTLETINRSNVKNLKLAFSVALGGTSANEYIEATPLVDDGFMYITDVWGVVYKIDVRSGNEGRIVWKMDPGQEKPDRNRGVALWGNLVISVTGLDSRVIATDKESGKIVWDKKLLDQAGLEITAAPLALKDSIIIGASGGDNGTRNWIASLDAKTGDLQWKTFVVPAPGEPGSETWKDKVNAWQTGGGALVCHRLLRSADEPDLLGLGQSVAALRFRLSARRQPLHRQLDRVQCRDRQDDSGTSSIRPTTIATTTRPARRSSSTASSTARIASCSFTPTATGSTTRSTATTASSSRRCRIPPRSPGPRASIPRPASRSTTIPARMCRASPSTGRAAPTCSRTPVRTSTAAPISGRRPSARPRVCSTSPATKAAPTSRPTRRRT